MTTLRGMPLRIASDGGVWNLYYFELFKINYAAYLLLMTQKNFLRYDNGQQSWLYNSAQETIDDIMLTDVYIFPVHFLLDMTCVLSCHK